jgi:hypothetical protein
MVIGINIVLQKETGSALTHVGAHLDLSAFSSWEELASLGLDRLKSALMALGLKCGGYVLLYLAFYCGMDVTNAL